MLQIHFGDTLYKIILRSKLPLLALLGAFANLSLGQAPQASVTVASAADYRSYVAPQSQAALTGVNLADATVFGQVDATGALSTEVGGTTVQVCGETTGIVFVSPSQINIVIPADLKPGICPVVVTTNGRISTGTADIRPLSPAFFTTDG